MINDTTTYLLIGLVTGIVIGLIAGIIIGKSGKR
jgi:ABC-type nitrate/sulfonate/bicarbonate transport system permease component